MTSTSVPCDFNFVLFLRKKTFKHPYECIYEDIY